MNPTPSALHAAPSRAADAPGLAPLRAGGNHRTEAETWARYCAWLAADTDRVLRAASEVVEQIKAAP